MRSAIWSPLQHAVVPIFSRGESDGAPLSSEARRHGGELKRDGMIYRSTVSNATVLSKRYGASRTEASRTLRLTPRAEAPPSTPQWQSTWHCAASDPQRTTPRRDRVDDSQAKGETP
jgi:hypothetical protein